MTILRTLRERTYLLLEGKPSGHPARARVQYGILLLILISTASLVLETVPSLAHLEPLFILIERVAIAIFTFEYLLRVWSCSAAPQYADGWRGRLRYLRSPYAIIDLLAILPFYLAMLPFDLEFLRALWLLRLLRIAKLARYSSAMQMLGRVVLLKRYELGVTLFLGGILLMLAAAAMYFAESDAQPEAFSSIPAAMWWAVATLTTVGYGDLTPITPAGRLIGSFLAILGVAMFALPTGILGAAFANELRRKVYPEDAERCSTCGQILGVDETVPD